VITLNSSDGRKTYQGRIIRINPVINTLTHTLTAYIEVKSPELKEGMYLETKIPVRSIPEAVEIPGHLVFENDKIFIVQDSIVQWLHIQSVYHNDTGVMATGIPKGTLLVTETLPAGKAGSKVIPIIQ
jgi:multidrug efflux pump subunit AcrA (membrane-fusion protein)